MKPIIKKKIKKLMISLVCAVVITSTAYNITADIIHSDNSSIKQTTQLQEQLETVSNYRKWTKERLQHNNGEPIYVKISDEFTFEQKDTIINALDHIFNIVGEINNNYRYQLVDNLNNIDYLGKTTIDFKIVDKATIWGKNYNGVVSHRNNILVSSSKGVFSQNCDIEFDKDFINNQPNRLFYTTLHELCHVYGMEDVYIQNEVEYRNTFMHGNTNESLRMITPNDYKLLVSMYAKDMQDYSETEKNDYINELKQKVEDYTIKYYQHYAEVQNQTYKKQLIDRGFSAKDIERNTTYEKLNNDLDLTFTKLTATRDVEKVRVKIKGDKYVIATYDNNDNFLEKCTGKAYNIDGQIFLDNVHFQNFTAGLETFTNLHIFSSQDSGLYRLRDTVDYIYCGLGRDSDFYNQQSQELIQ